MPEPVADVAAITVAATLATAPLIALHFEQVSLASLPANLLAAPVVAPVMWLGHAGHGGSRRSRRRSALPLNVVCAPLLGYLEWVAHVAAGAPLAAVPVRLGGAPALALAYGPRSALARRCCACARLASAARAGRAALGAGGPHGGGAGWMRPRAVARCDCGSRSPSRGRGALSRSTPCASGRRRPRRGELVVSFLDVGQGDATLLQRDGAAVLVDTGPPDGPILRRLAEAGVGGSTCSCSRTPRPTTRGWRCR